MAPRFNLRHFRWDVIKQLLGDPVSWAFVVALAVLSYCGRLITVSLILAAAIANICFNGEYTPRWAQSGGNLETSQEQDAVSEPLSPVDEPSTDPEGNSETDTLVGTSNMGQERSSQVASVENSADPISVEEVDDQLLRLFAPVVSDDKKSRNGANALGNDEKVPQRQAKQQLDKLLKCINAMEGSTSTGSANSSKTPLQAKLQRKLGSRAPRRNADATQAQPAQAQLCDEDPLGDESKMEELLRELGETPQEGGTSKASSSRTTPPKKTNKRSRNVQDRRENSSKSPPRTKTVLSEGSEQTSPT